MANQLGALGIAPRCHRRHLRRTRLARTTLTRVKHDKGQFATFLTTQATRLSTTAAAILVFLKKNTPRRIALAANTGQLS